MVAHFYAKSIETVERKPDRNDNRSNVNFTKACLCFCFGEIMRNVVVRSSKNSSLKQNIEAVIRDPKPLLRDPL